MDGGRGESCLCWGGGCEVKSGVFVYVLQTRTKIVAGIILAGSNNSTYNNGCKPLEVVLRCVLSTMDQCV